MTGSRWGIVLAGALMAATLPAAGMYGAHAALPGADSAASQTSTSSPVRVQPRLVTAPTSQWAILASANVDGNSGIQPVILGKSVGTRADDSIFIGYGNSTVDMGANLNWNLSTTQLVPAPTARLQYASTPSAAQGDDTAWMTLEKQNDAAELVSISRGPTPVVSRYPISVSGVTTLRALSGLAVQDDTMYVGYQTTGDSNTEAGILRVSIRNPQDDSNVFSGRSASNLQPAQLAKTSKDDTLVLAMYGAGGDQILVASPRSGTTLRRPMPWDSWGAAAGDDTIYVSQKEGNGLAAINPRNLDDSRIVSVPGAGQFRNAISVWRARVGDDTIDTVFLPAYNTNALWMVDGRTLVVDDSVALDDFPTSVTAASADLAYVSGSKVWAVGLVSGQTVPNSFSSSLTGAADDSISISLNLPELFTIDDSLIKNVYLDDTPLTAFAVTDDTALEARVPNLTGGPYSVIVGLNGGNRIKVGEFTYRGSNPPTPPAPPVQVITPTAQVINGVVGTAIPPTSKFTLENFNLIPRYSVYPKLPDGLVIDPTTGVVTGTPTVLYPSTRHWITASAGGNSESAYSTLQVTVVEAPPPPPVTRTLVLDQGVRTKDKSRIHDRITTTGSSTGIDPGTRLTPYIRYSGQTSFSEGRATIVVQADGTFRWSRLIRRDKDITGYVAYQDLDSNQVTWIKVT